jgi:2-polyprenyl-3-methyl-5-hydroxy-6-metoxy-1,4-benzoquinol methylase
MAANEPVGQAYDAIALDYETQMGKNPVAAYMRARLHEHFVRLFRRGDRLLDFTAGTGIDALFLAERGVQVTAVDVSPAMIAELKRNAAQRNLSVEVCVLDAERLGELSVTFDGAISTFAGLNTIGDMPRLAEALARAIRPGGHVVLHGLNRDCLWQAVGSRLRHRGGRTVQMRIGGTAVTYSLYNPFALCRAAFASHFDLREAYGLSVVAAPAVVKRIPRGAPLVFWTDRVVGRMLPAAGDFFVLDLEKRA